MTLAIFERGVLDGHRMLIEHSTAHITVVTPFASHTYTYAGIGKSPVGQDELFVLDVVEPRQRHIPPRKPPAEWYSKRNLNLELTNDVVLRSGYITQHDQLPA